MRRQVRMRRLQRGHRRVVRRKRDGQCLRRLHAEDDVPRGLAVRHVARWVRRGGAQLRKLLGRERCLHLEPRVLHQNELPGADEELRIDPRRVRRVTRLRQRRCLFRSRRCVPDQRNLLHAAHLRDGV